MAKLIGSKNGTIKGTIAAILNTATGVLFIRGTTFPETGVVEEGVKIVDFKPTIEKAAAEARVLNKEQNTNVFQERVFDVIVHKTSKGPDIYTRVYYKNKLEAECRGLPMYASKVTHTWGGVKASPQLQETLAVNGMVWDRNKPCKWIPKINATELQKELSTLADYFDE